MLNGKFRIWLRVEGFALLAFAVTLYANFGSRWWIFAVAFLAPDLTFFAYMLGPRIGSYAYNLAHTYALPMLLIVVWLVWHGTAQWPLTTALISLAHIGWDRMLGYGLKSERSFDETHLGPIGKLRTKMAAKSESA